jgi:hypothetical protein
MVVINVTGSTLPTGITLPTDIPTGVLSDLSSGLSDLASLTSLLPPPSILSVLETAVPTSIFNDPNWVESFTSSLAAGKTPGWYASLPASVKDYLTSEGAALATATGVLPTVAATTKSSPSPTSNLAYRPTGAIMASLVGAFGVLGLAIAL